MKLLSFPQFARHANRVREILTILSKYGLADWVSRLDLNFAKALFRSADGAGLADLTTEKRIRLSLTELGTTFIKLGQVLSTRADLVGAPLATELSVLQCDAPADAPNIVRATIEKELARPLDQVFADFEDKALASASIAQVHRARLRDGQRVVIKVQHPAIEGRIRTDLDILVALADLAEQYLPEMHRYRPRAVATEFQRMLLRELDFGREQRHLVQFARNFACDAAVHFPVPRPDLSTARVLTMEYLDGVPITEAEKLAAVGYDREEIARRGACVFLDMIFRDGFYHADPHPGNILVLAGGVIGMLDCGMVGRLDDRLREQIEDLLLAIATGDSVHLTSMLTRISAVPARLDQAAFSADVADFLFYYSSQPLDQLDLAEALTEMVEIIRRHQLVLPTSIAVLIKVLVMLQGTARLLNPHFNLTELIGPYQRKMVWRRLSPARQVQKLRRAYHEWQYLAEILPRGVGDILQQVQTGRFEVPVEHRRLEPTLNRLVFGFLTGSLFVGSALLCGYRVPPQLGDVSIVGGMGIALSVLMALRLMWAIRKSGNLDRP
jgi:ubiquinone biosynthesis protein